MRLILENSNFSRFVNTNFRKLGSCIDQIMYENTFSKDEFS